MTSRDRRVAASQAFWRASRRIMRRLPSSLKPMPERIRASASSVVEPRPLAEEDHAHHQRPDRDQIVDERGEARPGDRHQLEEHDRRDRGRDHGEREHRDERRGRHAASSPGAAGPPIGSMTRLPMSITPAAATSGSAGGRWRATMALIA